MSNKAREAFFAAIITTAIEETSKAETMWRRGLLIEAEKVEEINAIIQKSVELLQSV